MLDIFVLSLRLDIKSIYNNFYARLFQQLEMSFFLAIFVRQNWLDILQEQE